MIGLALACVAPQPDTGEPPTTTLATTAAPRITHVTLDCMAATHLWRVWASGLDVGAILGLPADAHHPEAEQHPMAVQEVDPAGTWVLLGVDLEPSPELVPGRTTRWDCDALLDADLVGVRVALTDGATGALLDCWIGAGCDTGTSGTGSGQSPGDGGTDVQFCLDGTDTAR